MRESQLSCMARSQGRELHDVPLLEVPTDRPRTLQQPIRPAGVPVAMSLQLQLQLQELSRRSGVTLSATLLTALAVLLSRYSRQTELLIGLRSCGHWLALKCSVLDAERFLDVLQRVAMVTAVAQGRQHCSELDAAPLRCGFALGGELPCIVASKHELGLRLQPTSQGLVGELQYNAALFDATTAHRLLDHYQRLLQGIVSNPGQQTARYELLSSVERHRLLVEWSSGPCAYPQELCAHELFEAQVRRTPDAVALRDAAGVLTYAALDCAANRLAQHLSERGVNVQQRVGLCVARSAAMVIGMLAILKAGGVYVPLEPADPPRRLAQLLANAEVRLVLTQSALLPRLAGLPLETICLDEAPAQAPVCDRRVHVSPAAPAYVIHTSGSTGLPKGVVGCHRAIANRVQWLATQLHLTSEEIFCQRASLGSVDHVAEIFQPLVLGAALLIISGPVLEDTRTFGGLIAEQRVSNLCVLPVTLRALLDVLHYRRSSTLRYIFTTGDVLPAILARRCFERLPQVRLFNVYGATEVGADVTCCELRREDYTEVAACFASPPLARGQHSFAQAAVHDAAHFTRPGVALTDLAPQFADTTVPEQPLSLEAYRNDLAQRVLPHVIDVGSPAFIGHMTSALPAFLPELAGLITQLNQNLVKVETSKALTLLERQVLAMLHRRFFNGAAADYDAHCQDPNYVFGVATSGGSLANITALACARNRALLRLGVTPAELSQRGANAVLAQHGYVRSVILASRLAHYSLRKAAALLGLGREDIVLVEQDADGRLCPIDLTGCIARCRANRELVIAMVGIAGATETGSIDPLEQMARLGREHAIHFHVDAAWGGALVFSPAQRHKLAGIEHADSITFCAHKQLYTAQGLSMCLFRDPHAAHANSFHADYQARVGSYDLGRYTLEGSRPAMSLMLHAVLHVLGGSGLGRLVDRGVALALQMRDLIVSSADFELVGRVTMNIVNYRYVPEVLRQGRPHSLEQNRAISRAVELIQERQFLLGRSFVSKTRLASHPHGVEPIAVFRVVLASPLTQSSDLHRVLDEQRQIAHEHIEGRAVEPTAPHVDLSWDAAAERVPIGKPIANVQIHVLDRWQQLVPIGVVGEICIAGAGLAAGYCGNGAVTAEAFVANPFAPGERLYRSGDLGRWRADGQLEFLGRLDRQVKLRGLRVELGEIEAQLLRVSGVVECAVVAEQLDACEQQLTAYVVLERSQSITPAMLRAALARVVPAPMVPQHVVVVSQLPLSRRGKVERCRLAASVHHAE